MIREKGGAWTPARKLLRTEEILKTYSCKGSAPGMPALFCSEPEQANSQHPAKTQARLPVPITPALGGRDREMPGAHKQVSPVEMASLRFIEKPCLKMRKQA